MRLVTSDRLAAADPDDVHAVARQDQPAGVAHLRRRDREARACPSARLGDSVANTSRPRRVDDCRTPAPAGWPRSGTSSPCRSASATAVSAPVATVFSGTLFTLEHVGRDRRALFDRRPSPRRPAGRRGRRRLRRAAWRRRSSRRRARALSAASRIATRRNAGSSGPCCAARNTFVPWSVPHVGFGPRRANKLYRYRRSEVPLYDARNSF